MGARPRRSNAEGDGAREIVILGGGTGGTMVANRLRRRFDARRGRDHVVDRDDRHVYQPGLLFVPFGLAHADDIVRPRRRQLHDGIDFLESEVDRVDIERRRRSTSPTAPTLAYDVLVVATGARLLPEETEGLTGPGLERARLHLLHARGRRRRSRDALARFDGGRLVVNVVDMPIKCPVAPLEFCFLADWYFRERGIRDRVELTYVDAARRRLHQAGRRREQLGGLLDEKEIELVTEFNAGEVDGVGGTLDRLRRPRGRRSTCSSRSRCTAAPPTSSRSPGLGDELDFVPTDEHTLQAKADAERLRDRRRHQPPDLEGRLGHALRGRDAGRERRAASSPGEPLDAGLRRPRQLLHRDRLPQGAADRLQLRHRAAARATSRPRSGRCRC